MSCRTLALAFLLGVAVGGGAMAQVPPEEPGDYRTDNYGAPVPATLRGARVVDAQEAEALWLAKAAIFIDVLPRPPKPANLPAGTIWREAPHRSIPGAVWLPNVGYGVVPAPLLGAFQARLAEISHGDRTQPLLFFCQKQCWMSWNAARRAVSWGYVQVIWFPEGTDGWADALLPLAEVAPGL
jgi:PQQ-dependent catabolism-associated CXXCW motif protein